MSFRQWLGLWMIATPTFFLFSKVIFPFMLWLYRNESGLFWAIVLAIMFVTGLYVVGVPLTYECYWSTRGEKATKNKDDGW